MKINKEVGNKVGVKKNTRKIALFSLLIILFIGVDYEFDTLNTLELASNEYIKLFLAMSSLLLYIVPFILLLVLLVKRWNKPKYLIPLILFIGFYSTGWIAGEVNEWLGENLIAIFKENALILNWLDALVAPLVEEVIKLLSTVLIIYLLKLGDIRDYFIIGICVGLAFQFSEDISYIAKVSADNMNDIFPEALSRISGSFTSHWLYTGILSVGIGSIKLKQNLPNINKISYVVAPFLLHFLWNSPLNTGYLTSALLSAISACFMISLLFLLDKGSDKLATEGIIEKRL